jgi:hypothetical protein
MKSNKRGLQNGKGDSNHYRGNSVFNFSLFSYGWHRSNWFSLPHKSKIQGLAMDATGHEIQLL